MASYDKNYRLYPATGGSRMFKITDKTYEGRYIAVLMGGSKHRMGSYVQCQLFSREEPGTAI